MNYFLRLPQVTSRVKEEMPELCLSPQTTAKIKPKEMAPLPYIITDISYLNENILQNLYGILNMDLE